MNVTFYTFSKKVNSTKIPSGGTSYTVTLKEGCSVLQPSIRLVWTGTGSPASYNYAHISAWGRYYWVRNWTFQDRRWTADLEVDPLASYKTQIGSSSQYVVRSASQYDGEIIDAVYPAKSTPTTQITSQPFWAVPASFSDQVLVVATMGRRGWQEYYLLGGTQYQYIATQVFASSFWDGYDFGDASTEIVKAIKQPENSIVSVTWLPINKSEVSGKGVAVTDFDFGYYAVGGTYSTISPRETYDFSRTINLTSHPDAATRGAYLNGNTYTSRDLFIPGVGQFSLDNDRLIGYASVRVDVSLNLASGAAAVALYGVTGGTGTRLLTVDSNVGVAFGYGTSRADVLGTLSGILNSSASASNDNAVGVMNGITDALKSMFPKQTIMTSSGSIGSYLLPMTLSETFYHQTEMDNTDKGRPLCKVKQISALSGFTQCSSAHIEIPGTQQEAQAVESFMDGGFFYE